MPPASEPNSLSNSGAGPDRETLVLKIQPRPPRPPRDGLLKMTLFSVVLGAVLAIIYTFFLSSYSPLDRFLYLSAEHYHHVLVPLFCGAAVIGVLILDRIPPLGIAMILLGSLLGLAGGTVYLLPGALLAAIWAARHNLTAKLMLGFLLLVPGVIGVYYSLAAVISFYARQPLPGMPPSLNPPLSLGDALQPMRLLPMALIGAWLLTGDEPSLHGGSRRE
jgi:hypothetical protein